jgi:hypothetical protein
MLLTLLCWAYITFVCHVWGNIILIPVLKKSSNASEDPELPVLCLTGMAAIGIIALWFSIFLPLALPVHICILAPAIVYVLIPKNRKRLYTQFTTSIRHFSPLLLLLLCSCIILILFISTWSIHHPDTLAYHAQSILSMELYKPIPGLVHLNHMLAVSSMWFGVQAIFRFHFILPNNFLFVNGIILCWLCLFLLTRIGSAYKKDQNRNGSFIPEYIYWILLLIYGFTSWTQIRLTAASASPDFITAIYLWAALYSFSKIRSDADAYQFLCLLFCCAAIIVKLSAIAIALLLIVLFYRTFIRQKFAVGLFTMAGVALAILPYMIRNAILSGYPFFPSAILSMPGADWKLSPEVVARRQQYITAYARFPVDSYDMTEKAMQLSITQWIPIWWKTLTVPDQVLLVTIMVLLLWNLVTLKKQIRQRSLSNLIILVVSLAGSVLWFLNAPAIRFGTGFLIPLAYALSTGIVGHARWTYSMGKPALYKILLASISTALLLYTGYRAKEYFVPSQLLLPAGVKKTAYREISCEGSEGTKIYRSDECSFSPFPCIGDSCSHFTLRGTDLFSGFKQK